MNLSFRVELLGFDFAASDGPRPIFDEDGKRLMGGFVLDRGDTVKGFISACEDPYRLAFTSGAPWYLTVVEGPDGKVASARVSEVKIHLLSLKIEKYTLGGDNE